MSQRYQINIEEDLTLLMTASIIPIPGMERAGLTRLDPRQRERDYLDALTYYLRHHPRLKRITFVENSGANLDNLRRVADSPQTNPYGKDVEFVALNCNNHPADFGGGFGEWRLMDRAYDISRHLAHRRYFAKMTGRQWLLNFTRLLEKVTSPFDFLCDTRNTSLPGLLGLRKGEQVRYIDARFWVTTPDFYHRHVRYLYRQHSQGVFCLEPALYDALMPLRAAEPIIYRFPVQPAFRGIAGHMHKDYGSWRERLKSGVRATARHLAPSIWL
jgi:hypothetical protein